MTAMQASSRRETFAVASATSSLRSKFAATVCEWWRRSRSRRDIMALNERELWDIGLTRIDVEREAGKPFWRE
jgi:uncharacterized protein YjiS (DUF1127 family)